MTIICESCSRTFKTERGLTLHWHHQDICFKTIIQKNKNGSTDNDIFNNNNNTRSTSTCTNTTGSSISSSNCKIKTIFEKKTIERSSNSSSSNSCDSTLSNQNESIHSVQPPVAINLNENFLANDDLFLLDGNPEEDIDETLPDDYDNSLIKLAEEYQSSGFKQNYGDFNIYKAHIELINMLKGINAPNYMFDEIMNWAIKCNTTYNFKFKKENILTREVFVEKIKKQFDTNKLNPFTEIVELPGSKKETKIICHDFKFSLYSLLNDPSLMKDENLLLNPQNPFEIFTEKNLNHKADINTGSVYKKAYEKYIINKDKEILCPIIFFIDKTHTDTNGRLCVEQVRFTLGIFNKKARNKASAWRTLGYINDQSQLPAESSDKVNDYQEMLRIILKGFCEAQNKAIGWDFIFQNRPATAYFRFPVMFIIGDTEGHDKLAGRYLSRSKVKTLCRYCCCPFDQTDDTEYKFTYLKQNQIQKLISQSKCEELQQKSMHCVPIAFHEVLWCDEKRGIYGGLLAELLHCLQKGLYEYIFGSLFFQKQESTETKKKKKKKKKISPKTKKRKLEQTSTKRKKKKKTSQKKKKIDEHAEEEDEDEDANDADEDESNLYYQPLTKEEEGHFKVFSERYKKEIDAKARKYGKMLSRQSDRNLPRTHFFTNYTTCSHKTASEMTGLLIVFLVLFSTKEGEKIDCLLEEGRTSAFMAVFELMLLLETFCKAESNKDHEVGLLNKFMPWLLETYKNTLNRSKGMGIKIIKFHLPLHFADDIMRFGSMSNFDSALGESHHKTEAKKPAQRTQRRKENFEIQVANRQIENITIRRAYEFIYPDEETNAIKKKESKNDKIENKVSNISYVHEDKQLYYTTRNRKKIKCKWNDVLFQKRLTEICCKAVEEGYLSSPVRFFRQHNRNGDIFRADPEYRENDPWYDWVYVEWSAGIIPAKLLLFLEVEECEYLRNEPFQFGSNYINGPGNYAISYSFDNGAVEPAHGISKLCEYGRILLEENESKDIIPQIWVFDVECIYEPCTAVPFNTTKTIINEIEWVILKPKNRWYDIFITFMGEQVKKFKKSN